MFPHVNINHSSRVVNTNHSALFVNINHSVPLVKTHYSFGETGQPLPVEELDGWMANYI